MADKKTPEEVAAEAAAKAQADAEAAEEAKPAPVGDGPFREDAEVGFPRATREAAVQAALGVVGDAAVADLEKAQEKEAAAAGKEKDK